MALNLRTFKTRTITAILFAAIMLTGLLWNHWSFLVLFSIIHFGCWWEYFNLLEKIYNTSIDRVIRVFFVVIGYFIFLVTGYNNYSYDFIVIYFGIELSIKWTLLVLILIFLFIFLFQNKQLSPKLKWAVCAGFIYISLSLGLILDLRNLWSHFDGLKTTQDFGYTIPVLIIASIWINDTMAYIVGSLIGKTPLSKISPKKTWEGTIGGIILSVIIVGFLFIQLGEKGIVYSYINNRQWFIMPAIASIAGTVGDLFESKLKRMANIKDSGSFMPGHGGFLDRFDSLLFAVPAVWIFLKLILH